jgi:hypothetical protein
VWDPDWFDPEPSFREPLTDPGTEPDAGPLVCIRVSKSWLAILAGCALQVCQPASWDITDPVALADVLNRSMDLLNLVTSAEACLVGEDGTVSITILAGDGQAGMAVTFTGTYTVAPKILVSSDSVALTASYSDVSTSGFTAHLAADVPVIADTTGTVSWAALT